MKKKGWKGVKEENQIERIKLGHDGKISTKLIDRIENYQSS